MSLISHLLLKRTPLLRPSHVTAVTAAAALHTSRASLSDAVPKNNLFDRQPALEESRQKYASKYADKIKQTLATKKVESVEQLKEKTSPKPAAASGAAAAAGEETLQRTRKAEEELSKKTKRLEEILKVGLLDNVPSDLVVKMWAEHHNRKDNYVSGVLEEAAFRTFRERTREYNRFVIPIPRNDGFETFLMEATQNQVAFVSLLEYKLHRENAPPSLVLEFFGELLETKGVALFRGLVEGRKLSREEGALLSSLLLSFYAGSDEAFQEVQRFRHAPASFDINKIVMHVQNLVQGQKSPSS